MHIEVSEWYRLVERSEKLARVEQAWRRVHDYGSTFTTPEERLEAGNQLLAELG